MPTHAIRSAITEVQLPRLLRVYRGSLSQPRTITFAAVHVKQIKVANSVWKHHFPHNAPQRDLDSTHTRFFIRLLHLPAPTPAAPRDPSTWMWESVALYIYLLATCVRRSAFLLCSSYESGYRSRPARKLCRLPRTCQDTPLQRPTFKPHIIRNFRLCRL